MTTVHAPIPPGPESRYRRRLRPVHAVRELWAVRELVVVIAQRQFRIRHKQAFLGVAWAIITPLTLMLVFSVFVRRVANIDTNGVPYPLFSYLGLIPWTFFSISVSSGGTSLVGNKHLLNKVSCPREVFPISSVVVAGIDMSIATLGLFGLFVITGFAPKATSVWVPLILVVQVMFAVAVAVFLAGVIVYLRDIQLALPIILQLGIFATPVAYGIDAVPESVRWLYVALNPLAAVIESYRRTVLIGQAPPWGLLAVAAASAAVLLAASYLVFKRIEPGFADVA